MIPGRTDSENGQLQPPFGAPRTIESRAFDHGQAGGPRDTRDPAFRYARDEEAPPCLDLSTAAIS
jgi:hypothetical protein